MFELSLPTSKGGASWLFHLHRHLSGRLLYNHPTMPMAWYRPDIFHPLRYTEVGRNQSGLDSLTETHRTCGYRITSLILSMNSSSIYSALDQMAPSIIFNIDIPFS